MAPDSCFLKLSVSNFKQNPIYIESQRYFQKMSRGLHFMNILYILQMY